MNALQLTALIVKRFLDAGRLFAQTSVLLDAVNLYAERRGCKCIDEPALRGALDQLGIKVHAGNQAWLSKKCGMAIKKTRGAYHE